MFWCRLFPTLMIALSLAAAAAWAWHSDWRRCLYWIAAAVLTFTVTW